MHKLSKLIVQQCLELGVNTIVLGKNLNFKQAINLGKKNNQEFCHIPFNKLFDFISYKALSHNINIIFTEESYTSKTSFVDKEKLFKFIKDKSNKPASYQFIGKRVKRGLFLTKEKKMINADVNGAFNIIRKVKSFLGIVFTNS